MQTQIGQSWSMWVTRGIVAAVFGIVALAFPFGTLASLVMLAAAFMFVDGVFAFFSMFMQSDSGRPWWSSLLEAVVGVTFSVALVFWPGLGLLTFLYLLASWSIVTGVFEMVSAFRLRKIIEHEWALGFAGLGSLLFGILLVMFPGAGLVATTWLVGAYAVVFGILMINTGINLRREHQRLKPGDMTTPKPV